jgi:uncharacterized protein YdeI (YjbR/CyaY-like superfamily)
MAGRRKLSAMKKTIATLDLRSRQEWRDWLAAHHGAQTEIWLLFHKKHTGVACLSYAESVEEALCYGWVDSLIKRLDEDRYARKFTPRKVDSRWSEINRRRYADLAARGLLAAPGLARPPTDRDYDRSQPATLPDYIASRLKRNKRAWKNFASLAPSYRRNLVAWIHSAKREATRQKRLNEAVALLAAGKELGMK